MEKIEHQHHKPNFGKKAADKVTAIIGSWKFILIQLGIVILWVIINIFAWAYQWDPRPFILLNLLLSVQAAFAAPIIMMSQNRMSEHDRRKMEMDYSTDRKSEKEIEGIKTQLNRIEHEKIKKILEILERK